MLQTLRPVGNKIIYKPQPLRADLFTPYSTHYYQSGTAALSAALLAVKHTRPNIKQPKVLIPAYTCPDIISAALHADIQPVLIDFEKNSPWLSSVKIKEALETDSTIIALVAINFLGIPERIQAISDLISPYKVLLIEDSAQDFPTNPRHFSSSSDLIISSFGKGKPLGLLGGGIILTQNSTLKDALIKPKPQKAMLIERLKYRLKIFLYNTIITPFFYYFFTRLPLITLGETVFNPLKEIAACPQYILELIESNYAAYSNRKTINTHYKELLTQLNSNKVIDLVAACNIDTSKPMLRYPILITDTETHEMLSTALEQAGLGVSFMYKEILPNVNGVNETMYTGNKEEMGNALSLAKQLITLPTHETVSKKHLDKITEIFKQIL